LGKTFFASALVEMNSATAPVLPPLNIKANVEKGLTKEEIAAAERQALRRKLQAQRNNNVAGGQRTLRKRRSQRRKTRQSKK
jgi:hypothetical protein